METTASPQPARLLALAGFVAVFLLAVVLRLAGLDSQPLWIDEAYSVWYASNDWGYLLGVVPQIDPHPQSWM